MEEKKKIALMTWYTYRNLGSVLQASALTKIIKDFNYDVKMISYQPRKKAFADTGIDIKVFWKKLGRAAKKIITRNSNYCSSSTEELFDSYIKKRIQETSPCRAYSELYDLNKQFDAFVCGSDQIWSPLCFDEKYFLSFVHNPLKMIAYAPSMGVSKIDDLLIKKRISELVSRFEYLSIREEQGANIIKSLTGKVAQVNLDPTLLITNDEWDDYAKVDETEKITQGEYILCCFLGTSNKYMRYVKGLSKKLKMPFYIIPFTKKQRKSKCAVPFDVGPSEFVSLIRNAKYVCTDSFHGMAFSINYNVPFSVFKRFEDNASNNQNSRVFSLLKLLKLENRLVDYKEDKSYKNVDICDFSNTNEILSCEREKSLKFLKTSLGKAVTCMQNYSQSKPYKITDMCCGCGACATICPKMAIEIKRNDEGFEHCFIDTTKCIRCEKCKTICPMIGIEAPELKNSVALYAVKSKNLDVLKKSSSGGVAHELSSTLLKENYSICGCTYDSKENIAKHIIIAPEGKDQLPLLQGSKYIQSLSCKALCLIREMKNDKKIAFFGTPCQVSAVNKMLRKKGIREQAILIDLICHGVPSYYLWKKYLVDTDKKYGTGTHPNVKFRDNEKGWKPRMLNVAGNNKAYKGKEDKDDFYAFFRRGLCNMKSCSDCPYRERSSADLRIGDYWGPRFEKTKQGVSMVIANSEKGHKLIETLANDGFLYIEKYDVEEYWKVQYPYNLSRPVLREQIIADLKNEDYELSFLRKKYCRSYDIFEKIIKVYTKFRGIFH